MITRAYLPHPLWLIFGFRMPLDIEKYRHIAQQLSLSEQEQDELIQALRIILESFIDRAYGRHPLQQCGSAIDCHLQDPLESLESKADQATKHDTHPRHHILENVGPS